jgi:hypothetical protein
VLRRPCGPATSLPRTACLRPQPPRRRRQRLGWRKKVDRRYRGPRCRGKAGRRNRSWPAGTATDPRAGNSAHRPIPARSAVAAAL